MDDLPWRIDDGRVTLSVRLTPKSARDAIGGLWRDAQGAPWLQAQVRAVPERGKANVALVRLLSCELGLPARAIALHSGETSRHKRISIVCDAYKIEPQLRGWMEQ